MNLKTIKPVLMQEAPTDGGNAGAGADKSAFAAAAAAGAAPGGGQGGGADVAIHELMPEKYRVFKEDKSFDLEASVRKLAPGYSELAKKLGTQAEGAPENPDAYAPKVEIDGFNWDEAKKDPSMQSFLKKAHAKGINNDTLGFLLGEYHENMAGVLGGDKTLSNEEFDAELAKTFKTPEERTKAVKDAVDVFRAFGEKSGVTIDEFLASGADMNPAVIRLLASIRSELGEDRVPKPLGAGSSETIDDLMKNPAYLDTKHKDHEAVSAKVKAFFDNKYKA
jgi:hypothetical protein